MITAQQLMVTGRGGVPLIEDVSLTLVPGRLLALVGPSGAGKSTLLSALAGDVSLTRGLILWGDAPMATIGARELAKQRAVVTQESPPAFGFSALEVVLMGRAPHHAGLPDDDDVAHAARALERLNATHLAPRPYPTLSGGERQRVQLARALAQLGDLTRGALLLDEPTASLDAAAAHLALEVVRERVDAGLAGLVVLHDLNLAAAYADTILLLHQGRAHSAGTPDEVLTADALASVFGLRATIMTHPERGCPLIVSLGRADAALATASGVTP